jgi:hypothetical protein
LASYSDSLVDSNSDDDNHGGFSLAEKLLEKSSGKESDELTDDDENESDKK